MAKGKVPADYEERVYAGILGKIIGVYLGRPFEGWTNERIEKELGEVWYYVNDKLKQPLVVADDDISGTFTFVRALTDHGVSSDLKAEAIGKTWLNYLIENRTVLWWGGIGVSTEHTAYHRLKCGIAAPESGSIDRNGQVVAEQIGAQIFIDGWAMACPEDPELAVRLAGQAASVSHDGEAVFAAQMIAAMEAMAFKENRIPILLREAQAYIPAGSLIYRLSTDLANWYQSNPRDWRWCFGKIQEKYGYDNYGGGCHVIPNYAIVVMALLYGDDDFQKSLMIACTAGWDTDCNAANVGCLMGVKNGLAGINNHVDFRGPVADRMYLPTADGGRCITDAVQETFRVVNLGRALRGQPAVTADGGARFSFSLPGSVQGFATENRDVAQIRNQRVPRTDSNGEAVGERALAIHFSHVGPGRPARVTTPTFLPLEAMKAGGYGMECSPTLYPGQVVRARVVADEANRRSALVTLVAQVYGDKDTLEYVPLAQHTFAPGAVHHFHVPVPDTGGNPIAAIGLQVSGNSGSGVLYLDWMDFDGTPHVTFRKPDGEPGNAWRKAWVSAASECSPWGLWFDNHFKVVQSKPEEGFSFIGTSEWHGYKVTTEVYPHLADKAGILVCGRGLCRYVALTLSEDGMARLVEQFDDETTVLAEVPLEWTNSHTYKVTIAAKRDGSLSATVLRGEPNAEPVTLTGDMAPSRAHGCVGLLAAAGHVQFGAVTVSPVE